MDKSKHLLLLRIFQMYKAIIQSEQNIGTFAQGQLKHHFLKVTEKRPDMT